MNSLSVFGTSSDAGKSTLSFALTYLLHKRGINVAPFKAQNVSNNSKVCDDGGEIAIPQHFTAEAIGIPTSHLMNPVLIKSGPNNSAHIIINGESVGVQEINEYYKNIYYLKPHVKKAFKKLHKEYDVIVAEGAGSPVELNLMDKDLSNIYIAHEFHTKIVLVADIERGGVFASVVGVIALLPKKLRENVVGVIINKFRGDMSFFDEGIHILEERFDIKVLGIVPFKPFNLGFEDKQSLLNYTQDTSKAIIHVGVINLPHMSNFTDFEPLIADKEIALTFITNVSALSECDVIILPGTKLVAEDLAWLRNNGFEKILKSKEKTIIAICGGYEMMYENILDPWHVESNAPSVKGFGRFKGDVIFLIDKIVKKGTYNLFGSIIEGYEIHNGSTKKKAKLKNNLYGTFIHGLFESDDFRYQIFSKINADYKGYNFKQYKQNTIEEFTEHVAEHVDIDYLLKNLKK